MTARQPLRPNLGLEKMNAMPGKHIGFALLMTTASLLQVGGARAQIEVLDKPIWMLPGRQIRIALP